MIEDTGLVSYNANFRVWNYNDGTTDKPLYNFCMNLPKHNDSFEGLNKFYNAFRETFY